MTGKQTRRSTAARQRIKPNNDVSYTMTPLQMQIFQGQWQWANDPSSVFPWMRKDDVDGGAE